MTFPFKNYVTYNFRSNSIFFAFWVIKELLRIRPDKIYVSTDPPVFVPFLIMLFCRLFGGSYVYHLQDIHPEAAGVVIPIHRWLFEKSFDPFGFAYDFAFLKIMGL